MRSKKIARQLKKNLECETIEEDLTNCKQWLDKSNSPPESLLRLINNFSTFLDVIDSSYEQYETNLAQAQRSLELSGQEVEIRNKELRQQNKKLANLLNNMQQAVFTIKKDGNIVAPVSKFADALFKQEIVGQNIFDLLYKDIPQNSEEYSHIQTALVSCFDESEVQWLVMEEYFPKRIILDNGNKILKCNTIPIWNDDNILEHIMYVVEDVTALEKLTTKIEQEKTKNMRSMLMIQEMIHAPRSEINRLFKFIQCLVEKYEHQNWQKDHQDFSIFKRELHTAKGDARLLGLSYLAQDIHRSESLLVSEVAHGVISGIKVFGYLQTSFLEYKQLMQKLFNLSELEQEKRNNYFSISMLAIQRLNSEWSKLQKQSLSMNFLEFDQAIKQLSYTPISYIAERYHDMIEKLSQQLQKKVKYIFHGEKEIFLSDNQTAKIEEALLHLIRNALDHGIELPAQRIQCNKDEEGQICLKWSQSDDSILIKLSDDGAGINRQDILIKAISKNLIDENQATRLSDDEILALLFIPDFSVRETAHEISGRGIGLDIVKSNCEEIGGSILISSTPLKGSTFLLKIPYSY